MDERILKLIVELADRLKSDGDVWTRADLASELKKYGIESDSIEVSRLVYESFKQTGNNNLRTSFITNDGVSTLVDDYKLHHLAKEEKSNELFQDIKVNQYDAKKSLDELNKKISVSLTPNTTTKEETSLLQEIIKDLESFSGASDIAKCSAEGKLIFEKYSDLKASYEAAENDVKAVAKDFVTVRGYVMEILDRQIRALKDVFGDSIIAIAPNLFDFNRIEFLDVDTLYSQTKLEYDRLSEICPVLMNEVRSNFKDSFTKSLNTASKALKSNNSSSPFIGLALAAIEMYGAHIENQNKVSICKSQLEALKQAVNSDVTLIGADYSRLTTIFKTINDVYAPAASAFCRRSEEVLSNDIKEIYRKTYNDPLIRNLSDERKKRLDERLDLEMALFDHISNIAHYKTSISNSEFYIQDKQNEYQDALDRKPKKPNVISKVITLGSANDAYAKNLLSWKKTDYPVVEEYEKLKANIILDKEELNAAQKSVLDIRKKLAKVNNEIESLDKKITQNIVLSNDDKQKIASKLENVVRLLKVGKQIVESKIDDDDLKAVKIDTFKFDLLPSNIKMNISEFCRKAGIDTTISEETIQQIAKEEGIEITKEERKAITMASGKAVAATIVLMDNYIELYKKRVSGEIQLENYKEQVKKMKAKFEAKMSDIDNKADVLAGIITRINTSSNKGMLREALIELGDTSFNLNAGDLDDIISGKKHIEI